MLHVMKSCSSRQKHTEVGDHTLNLCEKRNWVIHFVQENTHRQQLQLLIYHGPTPRDMHK